MCAVPRRATNPEAPVKLSLCLVWSALTHPPEGHVVSRSGFRLALTLRSGMKRESVEKIKSPEDASECTISRETFTDNLEDVVTGVRHTSTGSRPPGSSPARTSQIRSRSS